VSDPSPLCNGRSVSGSGTENGDDGPDESDRTDDLLGIMVTFDIQEEEK
jgi:hypothetical protein